MEHIDYQQSESSHCEDGESGTTHFTTRFDAELASKELSELGWKYRIARSGQSYIVEIISDCGKTLGTL